MTRDNQHTNRTRRDERAWQLARQRVGFRNHLAMYVTIVGFSWIIWFVTGAQTYGLVPWPVWGTIGWGIGIAFHFIRVYIAPGGNAVEKEYEKIMRERKEQE